MIIHVQDMDIYTVCHVQSTVRMHHTTHQMINKKSYAVVAPSESSAAAANLKEAMTVFMLYVIQMEGCDEPWVSQQRYVNCIYSALTVTALFGGCGCVTRDSCSRILPKDLRISFAVVFDS